MEPARQGKASHGPGRLSSAQQQDTEPGSAQQDAAEPCMGLSEPLRTRQASWLQAGCRGGKVFAERPPERYLRYLSRGVSEGRGAEAAQTY